MRKRNQEILTCAAILSLACSGQLAGEAAPQGATEPGSLEVPSDTPPVMNVDPAQPQAGGGASGDSAESKGAFGPAKLRQLSTREYRNSVAALLGDSAPLDLSLEKDLALSGLTAIGTAQLALSGAATEKFETAAYQVAESYVADPANLGCDGEAPNCYAQFVERVGSLLWRRPLGEGEVMRYAQLAQQASDALDDPTQGFVHALAGLLQSPYFLYRAELGEVDEQSPNRRSLSEYELASRLSYTLTGSPPDSEVLASAAAGTLRQDIRSHAERLIEQESAAETASSFFGEYMQLSALAGVEKDSGAFPDFDEALKAALQAQTQRTMTQLLFREGADARDILTTRRTFLNGPLSRLYGVDGPSGAELVPYEFSADSPRVGILSHAGFLALNADVSSTSPTHRGKFVREVLLCQGIPAPPDAVTTELPELGGDVKTNRDRVARHSEDPACAGCHNLMDPIGLGFENFDASGAYRVEENGVTIDATGELDGRSFDGPAELGGLLATHPDLTECMVRTAFRNAAGALATPLDEALVAELLVQFEAKSFNFKQLLLSEVLHPAFGYVRQLDVAPSGEENP